MAVINWYFMATFFCLNLSLAAGGARTCRSKSVLSAICWPSRACNHFSGFICKSKISASYSNLMPHLLPVALGGICMTHLVQKINVLIADAACQGLWMWQGRSGFNKIHTAFCLTVALLELRRFDMRV